jgi:hypothetical protein
MIWLSCDVVMGQAAFKFEASAYLALVGFTLLPQVFLNTGENSIELEPVIVGGGVVT